MLQPFELSRQDLVDDGRQFGGFQGEGSRHAVTHGDERAAGLVNAVYTAAGLALDAAVDSIPNPFSGAV